jgi:nucleotide-binding universal stress UspA family protein
MFKKIVVPLDGSELAEQALAPALTLGRRARGDVIFLRVPVMETIFVPAPMPTGLGLLWPDQSLERSRAAAHDYLKGLQTAHHPPGVTIRTHLAEGDVASVIVDTAATAQADLLVMSTHGYSGVTRWLLGSVTEKVLRHAPCPVFVVRSTAPHRKMVVPLDGSPLAEGALAPALEIAEALGCRVTFLRVVPFIRTEVAHTLELNEPGLSQRWQDELRAEAERYLEQIIKTHARPGLSLAADVLVGAPADQILNLAEMQSADVIATATHGRTGLRRWVYGSVAEKVLRSARCSMLVVRAPVQALN